MECFEPGIGCYIGIIRQMNVDSDEDEIIEGTVVGGRNDGEAVLFQILCIHR